jgi:hypothetical protein
MRAVSSSPLTRVPVAAGPAYAEAIQRLPSKFTVRLRAEPDNRFNHAAVAVTVADDKIGYLPPEISRRYFDALKGSAAVECPGRRAPLSSHENTGTDVLLDLTGVPCGD